MLPAVHGGGRVAEAHGRDALGLGGGPHVVRKHARHFVLKAESDSHGAVVRPVGVVHVLVEGISNGNGVVVGERLGRRGSHGAAGGDVAVLAHGGGEGSHVGLWAAGVGEGVFDDGSGVGGQGCQHVEVVEVCWVLAELGCSVEIHLGNGSHDLRAARRGNAAGCRAHGGDG